jgi:hypothetical protein
MSNKKWTLWLILTFIFFASSMMLINYIVDPFQHYRLASWYKITEKKQREMTAGLAKNYPFYETAIVGSSMIENFRPTQMDRELNTTSLKLSMSGMTAHEMHSLLETILHNNKNLKELIVAVDLNNFTGDKTRIRTNKFPSYLFDDDIINDIFYLLNKETIKFSFRMIKDRGTKTDYDRLWYTADRFEYSKAATLRSYAPGNYGPKFDLKDYTNEMMQENFNFNILPLIKKYPNIKFNILYPPYSFLMYKDMQYKGWLNETFDFKRYLLNLKLKNVNIYDFQCIPEITSNLDIYRDIAHFAPSISDYIVLSIRDKKHLINEENIETCIDIIKQSANKKLIRDKDAK